MMNLKLNLLSPAKKKFLDKLSHLIIIRNNLEMGVITITFICIMLIWGWMNLQDIFSNLTNSAMLINHEKYSNNEEARYINRVSRIIKNASQDYTILTDKLLEFANNTPKDIKLSSVQLNRQTQTFTIVGEALTRDALLNYQEELKKITWISNVQSPVSQLFQKNNIQFEFNMKLKNFPVLKSAPTQPKKINTPEE